MIDCLYKPFKYWSEKGGVYIISDTHFDDPDCKLMNSDWITPEEQVLRINSRVHKNDTLIHLGDVGDPTYIKQLKAGHKVLIIGNHDRGVSYYEPYFDEVYSGMLQIAQKIILSHEPIMVITHQESPVINLHGHNHCQDSFIDLLGCGRNFCADVINYEPINLGKLIKNGLLSKVKDIHRITIDNADLFCKGDKDGREGIHQ